MSSAFNLLLSVIDIRLNVDSAEANGTDPVSIFE